MDRGPARAFPRRRPGARAVLGPRGRVRRRRPPARRARPHDPRRGRLHAAGHQPAVQRLDRAARPLHAAGLRDRRCRWSRPTRSPPCRCAAPAIRKARSPWSACSTRIARDARARPRRGAAAQPRAGRRRFPTSRRSRPAPARAITLDSGDFPRCQRIALDAIDYAGFAERQARARARGPLSRHRHRQRREGHRPRAVRVRHRAHRPLGPHLGLHRRHADGAGHQDRARADLRRAVRRLARRRHGGRRRHRGDPLRPGRLRQPADHHRGLGGASWRRSRCARRR